MYQGATGLILAEAERRMEEGGGRDRSRGRDRRKILTDSDGAFLRVSGPLRNASPLVDLTYSLGPSAAPEISSFDRQRGLASDRRGMFRKNPIPSFRGSAAGREPGIHNHRSGIMDSGLAATSLRRPGMTR